MQALSGWLKTTFWVVLISAFTIAVAEFVLRQMFPDEVREYQRELDRVSNIAFEYHPELLFSLKKNISKTYVDPEWLETEPGFEPVVWSTNSFGHRGTEPREDVDIRVIVYGDSNIHARFTADEETFARRLEHYLSERTAKPLEVLNAGVAGYGPDQSYLAMREDIERLKPDVVIFHVFADNDLGDLVRNRLFDVNEEGELVETTFPRTKDALLLPLSSRFIFVRAADAVGRKLAAIMSGGDTGETSPEDYLQSNLAFHERDFQIYASEGRRRVDSGFTDPFDYDVSLTPDSESAVAKLELMRAVMARLASLSEQANVPVLVLIQPSSVDLLGSTEMSVEYMRSFPDFRPDFYSGALDEIATEAGLQSLNLFDRFSQGDPDTLYRTFDRRHWNSAGQDVAASAAATLLFERFGQVFD